MEWRDHGTVLVARAHGETSAVVEVFTESHGRHAGVVRGGISRRIAPHLEPGSEVDVTWRARLDEHIGSFTVEPIRSRHGALLADPPALAALSSVTALLRFALPEREPHAVLYRRSADLLDRLGDAGWPQTYLQWELALLEELGFGLDLSACAVTGATEDLVFVSPKTGRAVSRAGAGEWADRLLPLPPVLIGGPMADPDDVFQGLTTTGHFLSRHLAAQLGDRSLPVARERLLAALARQSR